MLLRKQYGYRLLIPPVYYSKQLIKKNSCIERFLYAVNDTNYYQSIPLNLSSYNYYSKTELVLRGCLTKERIYSTIDDWSYIQIKDPLSDKLCLKLRQLNPQPTTLTKLILGKKDGFLDLVPLQTLHQFYPHLSLETLQNQIQEHCNFISKEKLASSSASIIDYVITNEYYLKRFTDCHCFYLEDVIANIEKVKNIIFRISKPEISYILDFACKNIKSLAASIYSD